MAGVGKNSKEQPTRVETGPKLSDRTFQPMAGRGVVVLGQNPAGAQKAGSFRCQVSAEKQKVPFSHLLEKPTEKRQGGQIGEHSKEGEQTAWRERRRERCKVGIEIDPSIGLSGGFYPSGRPLGQGHIGVGGMEYGRRR